MSGGTVREGTNLGSDVLVPQLDIEIHYRTRAKVGNVLVLKLVQLADSDTMSDC